MNARLEERFRELIQIARAAQDQADAAKTQAAGAELKAYTLEKGLEALAKELDVPPPRFTDAEKLAVELGRLENELETAKDALRGLYNLRGQMEKPEEHPPTAKALEAAEKVLYGDQMARELKREAALFYAPKKLDPCTECGCGNEGTHTACMDAAAAQPAHY